MREGSGCGAENRLVGGEAEGRTGSHSTQHRQLSPNSESPLPTTGRPGCSQAGGISLENVLCTRVVGEEPWEARAPREPTSGDLGPGETCPEQRAQQAAEGHGLEGKASEGSHGDVESSACKMVFSVRATQQMRVLWETVWRVLKHFSAELPQQPPFQVYPPKNGKQGLAEVSARSCLLQPYSQ